MLRLTCVCVILIMGFVLVVMSFSYGKVVTALALEIATVCVAVSVVIGVTTALEGLMFKVVAAFISLVSIVGFFISSAGLNPKLASANAGALNDFLYIDLQCPCGSQELRDIKKFGIKACALQKVPIRWHPWLILRRLFIWAQHPRLPTRLSLGPALQHQITVPLPIRQQKNFTKLYSICS